jgi:hypothetical protein
MQNRKHPIPLVWLLLLGLILSELLPLAHLAAASATDIDAQPPAMALCSTDTKRQQRSPQNQHNHMRDCGVMCGIGLLGIPVVPSSFKWLATHSGQSHGRETTKPAIQISRLFADAQPRAPPGAITWHIQAVQANRD